MEDILEFVDDRYQLIHDLKIRMVLVVGGGDSTMDTSLYIHRSMINNGKFIIKAIFDAERPATPIL